MGAVREEQRAVAVTVAQGERGGGGCSWCKADVGVHSYKIGGKEAKRSPPRVLSECSSCRRERGCHGVGIGHDHIVLATPKLGMVGGVGCGGNWGGNVVADLHKRIEGRIRRGDWTIDLEL